MRARSAAGPSVADIAAVTALLGREPRTSFEIVVRGGDDSPVVLRNEPFQHDGTPMPTRYWLVDPTLTAAVGRIEAAGGVRAAEASIDPVELADAHARHAAERDACIPADYAGPRPSGGVGGTRRGVKCLHAHYAWFLAGGDDPVGRWVRDRLADAEDRGLAIQPGRAPAIQPGRAPGIRPGGAERAGWAE